MIDTPTRALDKLFREHPRDIGESYGEHALFAACFGWKMLLGGLACFLHALVPALCETTGSRTTQELYDRLTEARAKILERQRAKTN